MFKLNQIKSNNTILKRIIHKNTKKREKRHTIGRNILENERYRVSKMTREISSSSIVDMQTEL